VRPALVPSDVGLVCVGGATLGGSGKTRVAIACARELASRPPFARIVLVGHAYRALRPSARVVSAHDRLEDVGDEALVCARALASANVSVVIGPTRQAAIDHAMRLSPRPAVLVLDGPLRVRGRSRERSVSLLALDANRPWGSGRLPPAGDLRAPRERLLAEADHVVPVDATPTGVEWPSGARARIASLRNMRLGLFTAIARPDRLVRALEAAGVRPQEVVSAADHGPVTPRIGSRLLRAPVDAWVATAKCALHLEALPLDVPVGVLDGDSPRLPSMVASACLRKA
jgi:tetraacyldisaccharide 4'-kinase